MKISSSVSESKDIVENVSELNKTNINYEDIQNISNNIECLNITKEIDKIDSYIYFIVLNIILLGISVLFIYLNFLIDFFSFLILFIVGSNNVFTYIYIIQIFKSINRKFNFTNDEINNIKLLISKYKKLLYFGIGEFIISLILGIIVYFYVISFEEIFIVFVGLFLLFMVSAVLIPFIINGILLVTIAIINLVKLKKYQMM